MHKPYPAPINEINLKTIKNFKRLFKINVGFSDHTIGNVAIVAVTSGAKVIEKHIKINKNIKTLDNFFSQDLNNFGKL